MTAANKLAHKLLRRASASWLRRNRPSPSDQTPPPPPQEAGSRRTEITIETHRVLRITRSQAAETGWCDECRSTAQALTVEEAVVVCRVAPAFIYRLIEARYLHSIKQCDAPLICLRSLEATLSTDTDVTRLL